MLFFAFAENLKRWKFIGFLKAWRQWNTTSEAVKLFFLFFSWHWIAKTYDNCRNEGRSWISSLTWLERNSNLAKLNLHDSFNLPVILDIVRRPDKSRTKATKQGTKIWSSMKWSFTSCESIERLEVNQEGFRQN